MSFLTVIRLAELRVQVDQVQQETEQTLEQMRSWSLYTESSKKRVKRIARRAWLVRWPPKRMVREIAGNAAKTAAEGEALLQDQLWVLYKMSHGLLEDLALLTVQTVAERDTADRLHFQLVRLKHEIDGHRVLHEIKHAMMPMTPMTPMTPDPEEMERLELREALQRLQAEDL